MNMFIAGVGKVDLFKGTDLILTSKTLVDSSINLTVSLEDIRAGAGAKIYGKYAHSSAMTMKLTDAMWRMEFLAANIGSTIVPNSGTSIKVIGKTATDGVIAIDDIAPMPLYEGIDTYVWYSLKGEDVFTSVKVVPGTTTQITVPVDGEYCVKYIESNAADRTITVAADFIPDTLTAILTAPIFAGDANNLAQSTKVGYLSITIPRFMLNGTLDLAMSMTGAAQMAIEGSALAVSNPDCEDGSDYYAIISEVQIGAKWYTNLKNIFVEGGDKTVDASAGAVVEPINVYAVYTNVLPKLLTNDKYEVTVISGEGISVDGNKNLNIDTSFAGDAEVKVVVKDDEGKELAADTIKVEANTL